MRINKCPKEKKIIESAIEASLRPGYFIDYNSNRSFVSDLEKVKNMIDDLVNKEPIRTTA